MKVFDWVFQRTLNNVWFGICLMVLTAGYIAIGSGLPGVREAFEMDEIKFFTAWPLKLLTVLLVLNLVTVTVMRIPFTPPRYGVWCIHTGIVTLIWGMSLYYQNKVEGMAFVPRGQTAIWYYDRWDRALYVRMGEGVPLMAHPLKDLPRFEAYPAAGEQSNNFLSRKRTLKGIVPYIEMAGGTEGGPSRFMWKELGLPAELKVDVLGYHPYAEVDVSWEPVKQGSDGSSATEGQTAVLLQTVDDAGQETSREWLSETGPNRGRTVLGAFEIEHRVMSSEQVGPGGANLLEVAQSMHQVLIKVGGVEKLLNVDVGQKYELGKSGYTMEVESFDPGWMTMDRQRVRLLTVMIEGGPVGKFRRQLIPGRKATDWKLNVPGSGPMGQRQTEPLDTNLQLEYVFNDPLRLLPVEGTEKRVIVTEQESQKAYLVSVCLDHASKVEEWQGGAGELMVGDGNKVVKLKATRHDDMRRIEAVRDIPKSLRERRTGESGIMQVAVVKVSMGDWSEVVAVPFTTWAQDLYGAWRGGRVSVPGLEAPLQFQLGMALRDMPARVRLDNFELVKYPGATENSTMHRDFKSTVTITDWTTRAEHVDTAHMNNPIYFGKAPYVPSFLNFLSARYWTLFQAQWDPNGQRFTVLGVGNRPGVVIMTLGCILMTIGLMYAFYVKPIIIERMKKAAIEKAKAKGKISAEKIPVAEAVGVG